MDDLTHVSLFTGIGGIDIVAEWAGFKTVLFVENDKYCQKVLNKHWPDVPILEDIFNATGEEIKRILADSIGKPSKVGGDDKPDEGESRSRGTQQGGSGSNDFREFRTSQNEEDVADTEFGSERPTYRQGSNGGRSDSKQEYGNGLGDDTGNSSNQNGNRSEESDFPITLITGGFPCQPFSVAGKQRGKEDDRYLWPEFRRVISEVHPTWVLAENVNGINGVLQPNSYAEMESKALQGISDFDLRLVNEYKKRDKVQVTWQIIQKRVLDEIFGDLEAMGYEVPRTRKGEPIVLCLPACSVNAPHRRDRIFIVAHSRCLSNNRWGSERNRQKETGPCDRATRSGEYAGDVADTEEYTQGGLPGRKIKKQSGLKQYSPDVPNSKGEGLEGADTEGDSRTEGCPAEYGQRGRQANWWAAEPELGRVAYGIPNRVDRLRCLGNAVVPQQVYPILKAIADIERGAL